jgi:hypothetical protein
MPYLDTIESGIESDSDILDYLETFGIGDLGALATDAQTRELREACASVGAVFFDFGASGRGSQYVLEKFAKTFCEPMQQLWKIRLRQEDATQKDLHFLARTGRLKGQPDGMTPAKEAKRRIESAREWWQADLRRHVRHWRTFLPCANPSGSFRGSQASGEEASSGESGGK